MSSLAYADLTLPPITKFIGAEIGPQPLGYGSWGRMRLPTESIGNFSLTLTNLVVGSAIQIETVAGAVLATRTAASSSEAFTLSAYAAGNALNNLRIKVRKGTASPYYRPYETLETASVRSQSIYVSQIPDE